MMEEQVIIMTMEVRDAIIKRIKDRHTLDAIKTLRRLTPSTIKNYGK